MLYGGTEKIVGDSIYNRRKVIMPCQEGIDFLETLYSCLFQRVTHLK